MQTQALPEALVRIGIGARHGLARLGLLPNHLGWWWNSELTRELVERYVESFWPAERQLECNYRQWLRHFGHNIHSHRKQPDVGQ
jgi:hypothetical protein